MANLEKSSDTKPSGPQVIVLLSHTIGSIGQVIKQNDYTKNAETPEEIDTMCKNAYDEIKRIYDGYIKQIKKKWDS